MRQKKNINKKYNIKKHQQKNTICLMAEYYDFMNYNSNKTNLNHLI